MKGEKKKEVDIGCVRYPVEIEVVKGRKNWVQYPMHSFVKF